MKKDLSKKEKEQTEFFMKKAAQIAKRATCGRSKCGSVIVSEDEVIGEGFNSPSGNLNSQKRCSNNKDLYNKKVTDKTCCVHAEQRAIMDALKRNPNKLAGSTLYFVRLDEKGEVSFAGKPYCTICSKMALDVGVKYFVLWHKEEVCFYETAEYNKLSYEYN